LEGSTSFLQLASNVGALRALDSRNFDYEASSQTNESAFMPPYQRLLGDAMHGIGDLFGRPDIVDAQWRIVDPVPDDAAPPTIYEQGSWGPEEANELIGPDGPWHNPKPQAAACKLCEARVPNIPNVAARPPAPLPKVWRDIAAPDADFRRAAPCGNLATRRCQRAEEVRKKDRAQPQNLTRT
jgi:Glucose-6-phosphate dehydrogenase, C-terminal domain